jgi:hypothetical protein
MKSTEAALKPTTTEYGIEADALGAAAEDSQLTTSRGRQACSRPSSKAAVV